MKGQTILPCGSGDYMLQERGVPLNTQLPQQRDLNMQIYLFMQYIGEQLNENFKYVPLVNGLCKRQLYDDFSSKFDNEDDVVHFYDNDKKKIGKVKYDTFCTRLQELDEKWGMVVRKHGDIGKYKGIDYYLVVVNYFKTFNWLPSDTVETLLGGTNDFVIKVYDRLLIWYHASLENGANWTFTYKSLLTALGYSSTPSQNSKVKAALDVLGGLGLIEVEVGGRIMVNNKSVAVLELSFVGVNIKRNWITFKRDPLNRKF